MNWVLDHFQILIAVAAAIAYWLNQRRQAQAEKEEPSPRQVSDETEVAERTRRVQEEIRRKIAERRGAAGSAPTPPIVARDRMPRMAPTAPVPPLDPFGGPMRRLVARLDAPPRVVAPDESETKAALERQAKLVEQMRALEMARAAEQRRAAELAARATVIPQPQILPAIDVRGLLREPHEVRKAMVLREILGRPLALR